MNPKLFIGPMSKNIVDAVAEHCNERDVSIGLIPSRRQVDYSGGYVNNWTTKEFTKYVRSLSDKILLVRDHGGPLQGKTGDDGVESLIEDCHLMDVIHIDVWKRHKDLYAGALETAKLIKMCHRINSGILYEVGTEESIRKFDCHELAYLLEVLDHELPVRIYQKIKYVVIQSGTSLQEDKNTGTYNKKRMRNMISVAKTFGLTPKEHNGDYLPPNLIREKFNAGLESINIAPEFGRIETDVILSHIEGTKAEDLFFDICFASNRWKKWVGDDFVPIKNKRKLIQICGHYVFSHPTVVKIKKDFTIDDGEIRKAIRKRIDDIGI